MLTFSQKSAVSPVTEARNTNVYFGTNNANSLTPKLKNVD